MTTAYDRHEAGADAAVAMRRRSTGLRLVLMAVIAALLGTLGKWPDAAVWYTLYVLLQLALLGAERYSGRWGANPIYALCFASYAVAGFPTWHLWTHAGLLGVASATMFLCGMLAQLVAASLGARRLFLVSAAPLVGYLLVVPPLAFGPHHRPEALAILACALLLVGYLAVLWRGQQAVLENIERSRAQAEAANRAKTEFLAAMSHEIRTPMNAVLGAADLLGRSDLSVEQRAHINMLQDGGAMLMQVLNDVLDLSKIEAGKLSIERTTVDVHALIERCASFWRPRTIDAGLELRIDIGEETPRFVELDPTRTGQILFNLMANAIKFTAEGSITLSAHGADTGDGQAEIVLGVADTGIGISPEALERLFTPFEQADSSITRRFGGTGLGLAISQRLAAMMDGVVAAKSVEGAGSSFLLTLPVKLAKTAEGPAVAAADMMVGNTGAGLKVLVAEDNPANQRIIDLFLRPIGAQVAMVSDGRQAVEALQVAAFDVVLMDMQMPVMDGLEATRRVRASGGPNADVPIFALTANVMEAHREACAQAGMSGHIAKPIDARVLLSTVLKAGLATNRRRLDAQAARSAPG